MIDQLFPVAASKTGLSETQVIAALSGALGLIGKHGDRTKVQALFDGVPGAAELAEAGRAAAPKPKGGLFGGLAKAAGGAAAPDALALMDRLKAQGVSTDKLRTLLQAEADPGAGLRVQVVPGGCSGFEYDLALAGPQDGDEVVVDDGVRVIVDRFSVPYLLGVELDYEEGFQGAGFLIRNPNATSSCGCGKSFQA